MSVTVDAAVRRYVVFAAGADGVERVVGETDDMTAANRMMLAALNEGADSVRQAECGHCGLGHADHVR